MAAVGIQKIGLFLLNICCVYFVRVNCGDEGLTYTVTEECPIGTVIGNILRDAHLDVRYQPNVLRQLSFRFLSQKAPGFKINRTSGLLYTGSRIDRDSLCPNMDVCKKISLGIGVQPVEYFQIIKVSIEITDVNDNAPTFEETTVRRRVLESVSPGTDIRIPSAHDPDSPAFSVQSYQLSRSNVFKLKVTKSDSGSDARLILLDNLDREKRHRYQVQVIAYDGGKPPLSGSVDIIIEVEDANDNHPVFHSSNYEVKIKENTPINKAILTVEATDADAGRNARIRYAFAPQTTRDFGHLFGINNATGSIFIKGNIDYEEIPVYQLLVRAHDLGPDGIPSDTTVTVRVLDMNDNAPVITVSTLTAIETSRAEIKENAPVPTFIAYINVIDKDEGRNGRFNCTLTDRHFTLQRLYGGEYQIVTSRVLDREKRARYSLAIACRDGGQKPQTSVKRIEVIVKDTNDNIPVFDREIYSSTIMENNYMGLLVAQVNATDNDEGRNADIRYTLIGGGSHYFQVDQATGSITASSMLDHEEIRQARFYVVASDGGSPSRSASSLVTVNVQDVNDEKPLFTQSKYTFYIFENRRPGTSVGQVEAEDRDDPPYNHFSYDLILTGSAVNTFEINPRNGVITTKRPLDRESKSVYYFTALAQDVTNSAGMSGTSSITVLVKDSNDNSPIFSFPSVLNNTIYLSNMAPIDHVVAQVVATDRDVGRNGLITYQIIDGNKMNTFSIDLNSGIVSVNFNLESFAYEMFDLIILAKDNGIPPRNTMANLSIMVNRSIAYPLRLESSNSVLANHNIIIVISVACGSFVVIVLLIIAIVCLRQKDAQQRTHKYNCRMEALRIMSNERQDDEGATPKANGKCNRAKGKETCYIMEAEEDGLTISQEKSNQPLCNSGKGGCHSHTLNSRRCCPLQRNGTSPLQCRNGKTKENTLPRDKAKAWGPANQVELEVQQLLEMLRKDKDLDSMYSGDGSNTDSGRGLSEEGEGAGGVRQEPQSDSPCSQDCPSNVSVEIPKHPQKIVSTQFNKSAKAITPTGHTTFTELPRVSEEPEPKQSQSNSFGDRPIHSVINSPLVRPDTANYVLRSNDYGSHSNSDTSTLTSDATVKPLGGATDVEFPYSLDDIGSILSRSSVAASERDEDADTTTSGSYVVDPDDLCNEIDDLFFKNAFV